MRDSAALLDAVHGASGGEPFSISPPSASDLAQVNTAPGSLRIGMMPQAWGGKRTTPAILDRLVATSRLCSSLDHEVEEVKMPLGVSWDAFVHASSVLWAVNIAAWIEDIAAVMRRKIDATTREPQTLAVHRTGLGISGTEVIRALDLRNQLTRCVSLFFSGYDLLLTPTLPNIGPEIGTYAIDAEAMNGHEWTSRIFGNSPFTPVANAAGLPAMSVPLFSDEASNFPIGMQFVASAGPEDLLFRVAGQLERNLPWATRKPIVWAGSTVD